MIMSYWLEKFAADSIKACTDEAEGPHLDTQAPIQNECQSGGSAGLLTYLFRYSLDYDLFGRLNDCLREYLLTA